MIIRELVPEDDIIIQALSDSQKDFRLNNLENIIIDRLVLEDDHTPVAYGVVKRMAEAILFTNNKVSQMNRAKALAELMKYAEFGATKEGCDQLHCFVQDERLVRTLIKHYGFMLTKDIVLVKNL